MRYTPIHQELYLNTRANFVKHLKPNSLAIFNANDESLRTGDQAHVFKQNADLFYLSGIDQEETVLVLFPDCVDERYREILFLKQTNEHIAIWEGHKYTKEEATAASGIKSVFWLTDMPALLQKLIHWSENIYLNTNENDRYAYVSTYRDLTKAHELMARHPLHHYHRSAPIMRELRMSKHPLEIAAIQTACDITEKAFRRVLGFVKPGVGEYEIEAEITHEFIRNRATGHAYTPIIASGDSANVLHYIDNNKACNAGELLLMDFGAEYGNYAADLTRCIPVSGRFTPRQKDVYNAVLRVHKEAAKMLVIGNKLDDYHKAVGLIMEKELVDLGLLNIEEVRAQDPEKPLYKKYFMHGTSHHLGLDVHDFGYWHASFKAGMVFTCEPGIYIPEEGLGIRIENDFLITVTGNVDLMKNIPIEVEEIEMLMNK